MIAQDGASKFLPNIVPPSPIANELGKFGNVPVGMFTGAANISIPLLTFKTNGISVPLSLFYGSNGIKVDEVSSNVGLGWNLNFGGVITRTVRDRLDGQNMLYPPDNINGGETNPAAINFFRAAVQENADTESDIYSFNFNGNSGKFVYDKNGIPIFINNQKIIIQKIGTNNSGFLITATNGVKYYFTDEETTILRSSGGGHSLPSSSVTSWYLSKIASPNGAEILFEYESSDVSYVVSNSQTMSMSYPPVQGTNCGYLYVKAPTLSEIVSLDMDILGKRIKRISSNNLNDGFVSFLYNTAASNQEVDGMYKIGSITQFNSNNNAVEKITFNYLNTANKRDFLQSITYIDPTKKHTFEYIDPLNFPQRLSKSQDHWGYYNGKTNTNLVSGNIYQFGLNDIEYNGANKEPDANFSKIGLLKKIIYPTKGFTEFDYESNTYWGENTVYPVKTVKSYSRPATDDEDQATVYSITSGSNQRIGILGRVKYVKDGPAPEEGENDPNDTGHESASLQLFCSDSSANCYCKTSSGYCTEFYQISQFGTRVNKGSAFTFIGKIDNIFYFDAEAGKTYDLHLEKGGLNTFASIDVTYYATAPIISTTNVNTGGVRIKSTKDFNADNAVPISKRYYYGPKEDVNHSSGNKGNNPFYIDLSVQRSMCPVSDGLVACLFSDTQDLVVSSSSFISLFDTGNSNCFYKYVTVSEGGDNFENGGESKEFIVHRDYWGNTVFGQIDIKSAPWTNFGWDNGLEIKSQIFQKKHSNGTFVVVAENENKYKLDPSYTKEVKSYAAKKNFEQLCSTSVDNLSIVEYKTKGYWFYLETAISKKYDLNGLNPVETTTTYGYNNPSHLQLTSQSTKSSLKETLETKYYYPQDSAMAAEPFVLDMVDNNRIDTPLKTETFRDNIKQSEQKTEYAKDNTTGNLLLPKFIYAAKFPNSHSTANQLEKKITYDKYDNKGNILQYTLENGTPVSIIWGYNQTQPIAKIENATYDQAIAVYSTNDNTFRNSLPNAMVTTYTYIPLVGIKTITDPKGQVTTYDYDEFNRLKLVKDAQGNILTENQYHYKN